MKVEALYCGGIYEIQIENNVIFVRDNEQTVQVINLNSEQTEVYTLTNNELELKFPNVVLKNYSYFFMNYENDYNKNIVNI